MSRHLGVLRRAGLVREAPDPSPGSDARVRMYELRREPFTRMRRWLDHVETSWKSQLAEPERPLEGRPGRRPG